LVKTLYLIFFGNRVIRIFRLDSWKQRSFSLVWVHFPFRMVWRYGSGKTNGLVMPHFGNSIRPYITLCVTKVILSPKLWRILHHRWRWEGICLGKD
jgi:hypothetical protein